MRRNHHHTQTLLGEGKKDSPKQGKNSIYSRYSSDRPWREGRIWLQSEGRERTVVFTTFSQAQKFHTLNLSREYEILNVHLSQKLTMPKDNVSKYHTWTFSLFGTRATGQTLSTLPMKKFVSSWAALLNGWHRANGGCSLSE